MSKINLCVIFGGASSEHEVSLLSAASVLRNLDITKYNTLTVVGKGYSNYAASVYISTDGTTVSRSVSIRGNAYVTKTIDVSDLTGEYYVGVSSVNAYIKTLRFD